jgi:S-disulfanyl-L-cysteine oxidoreductase SoxD
MFKSGECGLTGREGRENSRKTRSGIENAVKFFLNFFLAFLAKSSRPSRPAVLFFLLAPLLVAAQTSKYPNIGRTATPQEIKAWDIDVRPDFKGLPKGQGSVKQGEVVWEAQCASCHGHFGESSEVFTPIAGGVTPEDMKTGRVKSLLPGANQPQRTTVMKLSTLSTLWDYINRAMPWTAPKSLSADDVYASTAYILHLSNVLPADFVLSDTTIREVQARLPNRGGMTTAHSLWPGNELGGSMKPDVQGSNCMTNCAVQTAVVSSLPDHAKDAHGNLAEQSRLVGASRGAQTLAAKDLKSAQNNQNSDSNMPPAQLIRAQAAPENIALAVPTLAQIKPLLDKNACLACHGMSTKLVGPSLKDIAERYKSQSGVVNLLSGKIKSGGQGVWGAIPMPAQALSQEEAGQIARWLTGGMPP